MTLPTNLPNRRKFLERSMLGFGSVFVLPSLLVGCTDHRDPGPATPIELPVLVGGGLNVNYNDLAKSLVVNGLGLIPQVGEILGGLVGVLWPSSEDDVWGGIKDRVEALIGQKIADNVYAQVSQDLQGLKNSTALYLQEVKTGNPSDVRTQWLVTRNSFASALPHFQAKGYEVLLLPMFAQFANMYLSILRDGVLKGKDWGRSPGDQQQDVTDLQKAISDFRTYAVDTYYLQYDSLFNKMRDVKSLIEPFNTVNQYKREAILTVTDFENSWAYYDVTKYPQGAQVTLIREIYSDPYGGIYREPRLSSAFPTSQALKFPTHISVWGDRFVKAVQVTYPDNSGPNGVMETPRMGAEGGSNQRRQGDSFDMPEGSQIVMFRVGYADDQVSNIKFMFSFGSITDRIGGDGDGDTDSGWQGYDGEALSSIYIHGTNSNGDGSSADCIVFGFMRWQSPQRTLAALRHIYITSPTERSAADFAQAFPTQGITSALITDELKAARQAYWALIKKRAGK